jgi:hypothetical protein
LGFARKEREPDVDFKIQFGGEQDLQSSLGKFFAVIFPWLLAIPLTAGNRVFNQVSNFTSLLFQMP